MVDSEAISPHGHYSLVAEPPILRTKNEFENDLIELVGSRHILRSVKLTITQPEPLDEITVGAEGAGSPQHVETEYLDRPGRFRVRIEYWFREEASRAPRASAQSEILEYVKAWWRGDERDEKGKILSGQFPTLQRSLELTLSAWSNSASAAIVFADIDKFKSWNDERGSAEGDRIIAKLGASLVRHAGSDSIVIHRTGDEYILLMRSQDIATIVVKAMRLRKRVAQEVFGDEPELKGDDQPGLSCGIAIIKTATEERYLALEQRAEKALKPDGVKRRGRVSIEPLPSAPQQDSSINRAQLAIISMLSQVGNPAPFELVWLNVLSQLAEDAMDRVDENHSWDSELRALVEEVDPNTENGALAALSHGSNAALDLSPLEIILALAHGVTRASAKRDEAGLNGLTIQYSAGASYAAICERREAGAAIEYGTPGQSPLTEFVLPRPRQGPVEAFDSQRAILVSIGPSKLGLPGTLFASEIYVDHRP